MNELFRRRVNNRFIFATLVTLALILLAACAPEVGSKQWCDDMRAKPKGDWTANQAVDFAKHCVLK